MTEQKYLLIGVGGTGTHFIGPALAFLDTWHRNHNTEYEFYVADGDTYSNSNLERQMFSREYLGKNKAEAMAEMYKQYPVYAIPKYLGPVDIEDIMTEGTIVVLGVDNMSARALVQEQGFKLRDAVVINGGNEMHDGNVQLWIRKKKKNLTPPLTYMHPEIQYVSADDRSNMTCAQIAEIPGGEQLIIANMSVAQNMLTALWRYHSEEWKNGWTELTFDLKKGETFHIDWRKERNWQKDRPPIRVITETSSAH